LWTARVPTDFRSTVQYADSINLARIEPPLAHMKEILSKIKEGWTGGTAAHVTGPAINKKNTLLFVEYDIEHQYYYFTLVWGEYQVTGSVSAYKIQERQDAKGSY
jgi:hypothetical protein